MIVSYAVLFAPSVSLMNESTGCVAFSQDLLLTAPKFKRAQDGQRTGVRVTFRPPAVRIEFYEGRVPGRPAQLQEQHLIGVAYLNELPVPSLNLDEQVPEFRIALAA